MWDAVAALSAVPGDEHLLSGVEGGFQEVRGLIQFVQNPVVQRARQL